MGWLVVLNGPQKGGDFRIFCGKNFIGTSADCGVVVIDPYVSPFHCVIKASCEKNEFVLMDLDSRNGTFLSHVRIAKADLIGGELLRVGKTEFKFKALC